jgi:hypothetical protein
MVTPSKTVQLADEPVVAHPLVHSTRPAVIIPYAVKVDMGLTNRSFAMTSKRRSRCKVKVNVGLTNVDHTTGLLIANLDRSVDIREPTLNDALLIACVLS